ncbi:MAG: NAD(P)-binding domain-containing protein [Acidimicrobiia bacterium]
MVEAIDVIVIGGGQAGLATSHELTGAGIDHVVLERARIAQSWRDRWDSFCLVLPNWSLQLPGYPYDGDQPDGFMLRDDIVAYLESYAALSKAPVREGAEVFDIQQLSPGWTVRTSDGDLEAAAVIAATGAFQRAVRPRGSESLPDSILQLDIGGYRNPEDLPPGRVLVVGSGQSGCQVAEDLIRGGREVFLACGRSPWLPRQVGGRDIYWWATESGFMDQPLTALGDPAERLAANPQLSGRDGGHDLHFRTLVAMGVTLLGHFQGSNGRSAFFAPDLAASVAFGDQAYAQFGQLIRRVAQERGIAVDDLSEPAPFDVDGPDTLDLDGFGAVIHTAGFRPDYASWIEATEAFDSLGFPIQDMDGNGVLPGLHFVGVHFLRNRKSALFPGVGEDASVVVSKVGEYVLQ